MVFAVIIVLGLLSSVITAIIAALLLVEIISALQLNRKTMVNLTIIACFAIGLGAALTPIGEPLSTIVIKTKMNESFFYLVDLLGIYIIPGVLAFGIIGVFFASRKETKTPSSEITATDDGHESINDVLIRAAKVYVFVMALVLLGTGFTPIIEWYVIEMSGEALYWVNMVPAILDNATLAAADNFSIQSCKSGLKFIVLLLLPFLSRDNPNRILVDDNRCILCRLEPVTYEYLSNCLDDHSYDRWRIDFP